MAYCVVGKWVAVSDHINGLLAPMSVLFLPTSSVAAEKWGGGQQWSLAQKESCVGILGARLASITAVNGSRLQKADAFQ